MKIIKDTKTGLLLKSFLLNNQDYLSVSVLCYFDLNNPDALLDEQAMWKESAEQLGKTVLDYAMPKPKAEVLLCGSCHNPLVDRGASHVKLKVGSIDKELFVFGERHWKFGTISIPVPFKKMPLDYAHAIVVDENSLPFIEDPKHLVTSKNSSIEPAGFMPHDIISTKQTKKLGTYDEKWKRELWPGFAADMDYSFFNLAPKDQQLDRYFEGGEEIKLKNMHPEHLVITSSIPEISMRCFATKLHKDKDDEFKEIKLHRDTLWLFPEIQRGIVIFRGTIEVADEVSSDIKYLNFKPIELDEPLKSLDEYYALQKKELDRATEFDNTLFEEADIKIKEAKKEVFDIPREVKESVQKTQGKRPSLKRTPAERLERTHKRIDDAIVQIDESKIKLQEMKDEFGHIVKIDIAALDSAKAELLASKGKFATSLGKADDALKKSEEIKSDADFKMQDIKNNPNIPDEKKDKMDFDAFKPKVKVWSDYAFEFLTQSVKELEKEPEYLHKLRHLGLAKRTIRRSWVGFNAEEKVVKATEWNLDSKEDIKLPKGFVIARFEEATLKSLRIKDTLVLGSDEAFELFLSEGNENFPLFYLKDDIEAHLCDQEAYDICNSLVCDDVSAVGDEAKASLEKASVVFYLKEDGMIEKLPNAKKFDCGEYKNLFELHQNGIEIREQIIENLPADIMEALPIKRDVSPKAIHKKSKEITDKVRDELKAKGETVKKEMEAKKDEAIAKANEALKKRGLEPLKIPEVSSTKEFIKPSIVAENFDKAIATLKKRDGDNGIDLKDKILQLTQEKEKMVALVQSSKIKYDEGMIKIAQAKEKAKDPIPQWAKDMMIKVGIDPQDPFPSDLTREMVVKLHAEGKSFATKNLSELDLSDLDLSGIDLTQANCTKTDFTHTNLSDAKADMTIFKESIFKKSILNGFLADKALFEKADIEDAKFKDTKFGGSIFKDTSIKNTSFDECDLESCIFMNSSIKKSTFDNSRMNSVLFSESSMDDCDLINIDASKMLFNKSKVTACDFSQSQLYNMRVLKFSSFKTCNFSSCNMEKSTFFEVSLDDCNFQQTKLGKSLIKKSELKSCDFRGVVAKKARFEYSTFLECSFVGIDLMKGSLRRMNLQICDFSQANLYGVEFYKTKLYDTKLVYANLKRSNLEDRVEFIYE